MKVKQEHSKRDNILNNDAWSRIASNSKNLDQKIQNMKNSQNDNFDDCGLEGIQNANYRAQFSDFNLDGLKQFNNKHVTQQYRNQGNSESGQFKNDQNPNLDFTNRGGQQNQNCKGNGQNTAPDPFGDFTFSQNLENNQPERNEDKFKKNVLQDLTNVAESNRRGVLDAVIEEVIVNPFTNETAVQFSKISHRNQRKGETVGSSLIIKDIENQNE